MSELICNSKVHAKVLQNLKVPHAQHTHARELCEQLVGEVGLNIIIVYAADLSFWIMVPSAAAGLPKL